MTPTVPSDRNTYSGKSPHIPKPKILFLAYYFPPCNSSGSVRTWNIARHLARLGWDVTVVTPHPSVWRKIEYYEKVANELDSANIKRILTGHQWRSLLPGHLKGWNEGIGWVAGGVCRTIARHLEIDSHIGWVKNVERACARLNPKDADIILASGAPFIAFKLAKRLADRLGCPYVLDYRDPWTGNPHNARLVRLSTIQEEAGLLKGCAAITIVSPSWGVALDRTYRLGSKLHVVSNGYDPDEAEAIKPHHFGHCAFVYTGNFYPPKRVISPFLAALKRLKENLGEGGNTWYFH
ncbi:MAG: glycosyltransferase, partial [Nitrospira sp.]|nr:glycosyltransferase [Nitrospira sp.]